MKQIVDSIVNFSMLCAELDIVNKKHSIVVVRHWLDISRSIYKKAPWLVSENNVEMLTTIKNLSMV